MMSFDTWKRFKWYRRIHTLLQRVSYKDIAKIFSSIAISKFVVAPLGHMCSSETANRHVTCVSRRSLESVLVKSGFILLQRTQLCTIVESQRSHTVLQRFFVHVLKVILVPSSLSCNSVQF